MVHAQILIAPFHHNDVSGVVSIIDEIGRIGLKNDMPPVVTLPKGGMLTVSVGRLTVFPLTEREHFIFHDSCGIVMLEGDVTPTFL